jgi:hypothetical protein
MTTVLDSPPVASRSLHPNPLRWSRGTGALVSGVALALMVPTAVFGVFIAVGTLVTVGDAERTAHAIAGSPALWIAGVVSLFLVVVLDFVAAAGMTALFLRVNRTLSIVAGILRVAYGVIFAVAISQLAVAFTALDDPERALEAIDAFQTIWMQSLGMFGISLLVVAYLAIRSGFIPKVFGILVGIAGLGYIADTTGVALVEGFAPIFGNFGFVGEVAIIVWLLVKGRRLPLP